MFTCSIDSLDDIEALVIALMMLLIARLVAEHATSHWQHEIKSVYNSILHGNVSNGDVNSNCPVRCCGLLRMQQHVLICLYDE